MYDYVTKELPVYLMEEFPNIDTTNASLMGHSMGGHGALTIFFKNYNKYKKNHIYDLLQKKSDFVHLPTRCRNDARLDVYAKVFWREGKMHPSTLVYQT